MGFCGSCGAVRTDAADQFCRTCGQPLEPLSTPPSAQQAPPSTLPSGPPPSGPPSPYQSGAVPGIPVNPSTQPPAWSPAAGGLPGRFGRPIVIGGAALALVVGGFVVWRFLAPGGGAGSPEDAAADAVQAAMDQDPVALLEVISPAEVDGLSALYGEVEKRAEDAGVLSGDGLTDAVRIELTDLEFDVDELGDDMARVTLKDGRYDVSWDPAKLPERLDSLRDESEPEAASGSIEDLFEDEWTLPTVITVKEGGGWYVTALGTAADYAYRAIEYDEGGFLSEPDWDAVGEEVEPIVGEDPEQVIDNLVDAINDQDVGDALANFDPELIRPLLPYAEVVQDQLDRYGEYLEVDASNLDLETEELGDGRLRVTIEGGTFTGVTNYGSAGLDVRGSCVEGYEEDGYDTDSDTLCLDYPWFWLSSTDEEISPDDLGVDGLSVVMREVDGGYQLDPTGTAVDYAQIVLENVSGPLVEDILDEVENECC